MRSFEYNARFWAGGPCFCYNGRIKVKDPRRSTGPSLSYW
ncbi:hypothetical protein GEOBRER4_n2977 [Citrifermentans bremense]|uniref:Uncharacterized protein n=1 Tax=Citrifermentans bremense TaxID=60035 RepID=A0A7R7FTD5_9BACT|nr:hypothetical protein GEOBRER4_n2977 [Citrifermentans bremense]